MSRYIAVIDLGKTNSKVALVDAHEATELTVETQPAQTRQTDGYTSLDSDAIEAFIKSSLRKLARFHQLDAITVTTHAATAGLVDINGQLALPVMDYEFQGVDDYLNNTMRHGQTLARLDRHAYPAGSIWAHSYSGNNSFYPNASLAQDICSLGRNTGFSVFAVPTITM